MELLISSLDNDYDSNSDYLYSIGDEIEDFDSEEELSDELEMPYWVVTGCSLREKFDPKLEVCSQGEPIIKFPMLMCTM